MFKIKNYILMAAALIFSNTTQAGPLINGKAVFESVINTPITGEIDVASKFMVVDDWIFFGAPVVTSNVELLEPGNYTRIAGDITVNAGQIGAHVEINWLFNQIFIYMVWDVSNDGSIFAITDSDGDGVLGNAMTNGPFLGTTIYYEFETTPSGPAEPGVRLILNVEGGALQECTSNLGALVTVNALTSLIGGAELDSVSWVIDGNAAGSGLSISQNLALGTHNVEAIAITTTGQSDVESTTVTVRDTTRPVATISVLDEDGVEILSSREGEYYISISATDTCDPSPVITSSTATPATVISDGDLLKIDQEKGIRLPVTAVRLTVTAKDASGNFSFTNSESSKTVTLE